MRQYAQRTSGVLATGHDARSEDAALACVVLAHADPVHVRRLVLALDPFPVFLHCDARTPEGTFARMTNGLPDRVTVMPRRGTSWGSWQNVMAEVDGLRRALLTTGASHIAVMTGADYPLAPSAGILDNLRNIPGRSVLESRLLPHPYWRKGGFWRLRYRFAAWRRHMFVLPLPRRLPEGTTFAGGSQLKILCRSHAEAVVRTVDSCPELVRFWRTTWIPDETFVHSVLSTPSLVPDFAGSHVDGTAWVIRWDGTARQSPPWLTSADLPYLRRHVQAPRDGVPKMFARKFSTTLDTAVLDEIDRTLRALCHEVTQTAPVTAASE